MKHTDAAAGILAALRASGHRTHAIVDAELFTRLSRALAESPDVVETPDVDLRFIEGVADLPLGFLKSFFVTFDGESICGCGRRLSAADVVGSALKGRIHPRELIARTLAGMENLVELSEGGRSGACLACGRQFVAASYWTDGYAYA